MSYFAKLTLEMKHRIAQRYADRFGMAAFPVIGKSPASKEGWEQFRQRPGVQGSAWLEATGYALAPVVKSTLCIIDVDDPEFLPQLYKAIPSLARTFRVTRANHTHLYVRLANPLPAAALKRRDGKREIASLRGYGSYVVGPLSDHPSGDCYQPGDKFRDGAMQPIALGLFEEQKLLDLFKPDEKVAVAAKQNPLQAGSAIPLRTTFDRPAILGEVERLLRARGYRQNREWLNGRCLFPENHENGDRHGSAGVNLRTGVCHCFTCGDHSLHDVAVKLDLVQPSSSAEKASDRPYAFSYTPDQPLADDVVGSELNIATSLIRRGYHAAARFFDLLADDSRRNGGQHTYETTDLLDLGKGYGLSRTQVVKATGRLVELGLLHRLERGVYRRVGMAQVQKALGIGQEYALAAIPASACRNVAEYTRQIVHATERLLPGGLAAKTIGESIGISERSLYQHEERLPITRTANVRFTSLGQPTVCFARVQDTSGKKWRTVRKLNNLRARRGTIPDASGGDRVLAWQQLPSIRNVQ